MGYKAVPNAKGGYWVQDEDTGEHADCNGFIADHSKELGLQFDDGTMVTPDMEAQEWFRAQDAKKQAAYEAANAAPKAQADTTQIPVGVPRVN